MLRYSGKITLSYDFRIIEIPYTMTNLGGSPHIYYDDKRGYQHSFSYNQSADIWMSGVIRSPKWPTDFSQQFFKACTEEARKHGLIR